MNKWEDLSYTEQCEVAELFTNWLKPYTQQVVNRVARQANEILENDHAMTLIRELYKREAKEQKDFESHLKYLLDDYKGFAKFSPHNHATTHAKSYRDILYDMYIAR
jgi:hypothetical protein